MALTPDRHAGPLDEEEIRLEDRGPGGDNLGDPTIEGALRRVTNTLRYFAGATVRQVLQVQSPPVGFLDMDLAGVVDGQFLKWDNLTKKIKPGSPTGGGISEGQHEALDTLAHNISETSFVEVVRTGGRVSSVIVWTNSGKTIKIRETSITRTGGLVSQVIDKQYDAAGLIIAGQTDTQTITRIGGRVASIASVVS